MIYENGKRIMKNEKQKENGVRKYQYDNNHLPIIGIACIAIIYVFISLSKNNIRIKRAYTIIEFIICVSMIPILIIILNIVWILIDDKALVLFAFPGSLGDYFIRLNPVLNMGIYTSILIIYILIFYGRKIGDKFNEL